MFFQPGGIEFPVVNTTNLYLGSVHVAWFSFSDSTSVDPARIDQKWKGNFSCKAHLLGLQMCKQVFIHTDPHVLRLGH